jgi:hypothetical protein
LQDFTSKKIPRPEVMEINPACQWVVNGEGIATRKWDGTSCAVINGQIHARYDAKTTGKKKRIPPAGAIACCDPDSVTGHWPHWIPAIRPDDQYIREAFKNTYLDCDIEKIEFQTFEAIGPKINGNNEKAIDHIVFEHGLHRLRTLDSSPGVRSLICLKKFLEITNIEGVVFHHFDGRMAKIRRVDFGLAWPPKD